MSNMIKLDHPEYDEFWLDIDLVPSVGIMKAQVATPHGVQIIQVCMATTNAGAKLVFTDVGVKDEILAAKERSKHDPRDLDVPDAILKGWDDVKKDDDDTSKRAKAS